MRIGLAYNVKRGEAAHGKPEDDQAEFDSPATVQAIAKVIEDLGHEVLMFEAVPSIARKLRPGLVDLVFNIAEGRTGRSREAQVPALCELLGIPCTGSDSGAMVITLDKALCKTIVQAAGVRTARWQLMGSGSEELRGDLRFPLIVKPNAEGSSKGIRRTSVVHDLQALRTEVDALVEAYQQPALVEEFIAGREVTVGVLGNGERARVLPPMEIVHLESDDHSVYDYVVKQEWEKHVRYECPAQLPPEVTDRVMTMVRQTAKALSLRDVSRVDIRMDKAGNPHFLEVNPLPGLAPGYSDLVLLAQSNGISHRELIASILNAAIERCGLDQVVPMQSRRRGARRAGS